VGWHGHVMEVGRCGGQVARGETLPGGGKQSDTPKAKEGVELPGTGNMPGMLEPRSVVVWQQRVKCFYRWEARNKRR